MLFRSLKEDNECWETMFHICEERKYRKMFNEEWKKEYQKELDKEGEGLIAGSPDFDYVYELYFKQKAEIKRLKKQLKSLQEDMKLEVGIRNKEIERLNKENDQLVIEKRIIKDQKYEALQKLDEMTNKCNEIYWFKHYEQAVKDMAREICLKIIKDQPKPIREKWVEWFKKEYGVEVE